MCHGKVRLKLKRKFYKTAIRLFLIFGAAYWATYKWALRSTDYPRKRDKDVEISSVIRLDRIIKWIHFRETQKVMSINENTKKQDLDNLDMYVGKRTIT